MLDLSLPLEGRVGSAARTSLPLPLWEKEEARIFRCHAAFPPWPLLESREAGALGLAYRNVAQLPRPAGVCRHGRPVTRPAPCFFHGQWRADDTPSVHEALALRSECRPVGRPQARGNRIHGERSPPPYRSPVRNRFPQGRCRGLCGWGGMCAQMQVRNSCRRLLCH